MQGASHSPFAARETERMSPLSRCTPLARFFVALNFVVAFQVVAAALTDSKAKFEKTSRTCT